MVMRNMNHRKKSEGRQKKEIKLIENNKNNLHATFSQRRTRLFEKATELSILSSAQLALITVSPGDNLFSYGHPTVDSVIDHYLHQTTTPPHGRPQSDDQELQRCYSEYVKGLKDLEDEKKKSLAMISKNNNPDLGFWWDNTNVDDLGLEDLEDYLMALKELKRNVDNKINEMS